MTEEVFSFDEMDLKKPDPSWTKQQLLSCEGIFYLKDIAPQLELNMVALKRKVKQIQNQGQSAWKTTGIRKIWNHWLVKMTTFAPYYQEHLVSRVSKIDPKWDGNILLQQKGLFVLTDVCKLIPFSSHQLRYQAKRVNNPQTVIGVFKDKELKKFLVDMQIFGPWITQKWREEE
ncbi:hypothetical protein [Acanthopleuribacter pedis]|uniref:Uncharacterized protein n=1 Tax=Acanthopleuribacter pedis TaxID=442870 RepID=A0A8J7Q055_9BACT|nr:hypothetical protein [Acanthopleuribacter pedis]MBO1317962.1 hypothetical protein [Acanthopleuribacter pedis]